MTIKTSAHLLLYAFAFGGTSFYSFIASPIAFKVLERDQFSTLQNHVFPLFFKMQSISPVVIGLTSPVGLTTMGITSLAVSSLGGLTNLFWLMPWARKIKEERRVVREQYKNDAEQLEVHDAPLRKEFGKSHGLSLLFNMTHIAGLLAYGVVLSRSLARYIPK
ncbi:putative mitochondrial outer membrane protein [Nakaseomyces bracarensis]|uniref:Mitochondrial outer membrane protein n=1 Tax=Nakaseomyces bracarensis TaxID=273131 RepID=A0ABR4NRK0_9SACH